jgi:chemotaxis signal transduction protein
VRTMVCFTTDQGAYALPVESTLAVRTIDGLVSLPAPRRDIVGLLPGDPPLSVLSALGAGGDRVLVVSSDGTSYGLHVLDVTGVRRVDESLIGPPPGGQDEDLISGTLHGTDELVLIADAHALAARL